MRACLVAGSRECKDQAVTGQMRFGGAVFVSFHFKKMKICLTEENFQCALRRRERTILQTGKLRHGEQK